MAKPARPSPFDPGLSKFMVNPLPSAPELSPEPDEPEPAVAESAPEPASARKGRAGKAAPPPPAKVEPAAFRTSVYFHRVVHDKLRDIAHAERKSVMDLINEGLDHVLKIRNYPTTGQLRGKE